MIRSLLLVLLLVSAPILAQAQEGSPAAEHKWSVSTGLGFASSIGSGPVTQSGFNWQADGQYRLLDNISVGLYMQVVPFTGGTLFSFAPDARYHFGFLRENSNEFVSKLTPYAGLGMGLAHVGSDFGNASANSFLLAFIVGMEYDLTDKIALTSDMRFNIVAPTLVGDRFYYSWQLIGARYRF